MSKDISPDNTVKMSNTDIAPLKGDMTTETYALGHAWVIIEKEDSDGTETYYETGIKRLYYIVSLNASRVMSGLGYLDLWNEIEIKKDGRSITHVIGSLPRDGAITSLPYFREKWGMAQQIKELGVSRILSVVEKFELENQTWPGILSFGLIYTNPVKSDTWEELGIDQLIIGAEDFYGLSFEEFEEGVSFLINHKAYIHCKAGRGRSVSEYMGFLIVVHGLSFEEAYAVTKMHRTCMNINENQKNCIMEFVRECKDRQTFDGIYPANRIDISEPNGLGEEFDTWEAWKVANDPAFIEWELPAHVCEGLAFKGIEIVGFSEKAEAILESDE